MLIQDGMNPLDWGVLAFTSFGLLACLIWALRKSQDDSSEPGLIFAGMGAAMISSFLGGSVDATLVIGFGTIVVLAALRGLIRRISSRRAKRQSEMQS